MIVIYLLLVNHDEVSIISIGICFVVKYSKCTNTCGPAGKFTAAGSTTAAPVTLALSVNYVKICGSAYGVMVNATESSDGAKKVCNFGGDADIGNMSRDWKSIEANKADNGTTFTCLTGIGSRSVHRIPVAIDGVALFMEKGSGFETNCGSKLNLLHNFVGSIPTIPTSKQLPSY